MKIRKASIEDKDELVKLLDEFNEYYFEEKIFSEEFIPFWEYKDKQAIFNETVQEWLTNPEYFFFVAEEERKIIGYIVGQIKDRDPRVMDKEGYINDWFVKKKWRSKGVGMSLYNMLLKEFQDQACNRLGLYTNIRNKKTIDFYHKLGFIDESLTLVKKIK